MIKNKKPRKDATMKVNKKKLFLAVLMASGLFTSQQALANDTSQKNI